MSKADRAATKLVGEIDEAELAMRFIEIAIGLKRPVGADPREELLRAAAIPGCADIVETMRKQARASVLYFHECISKSKPLS